MSELFTKSLTEIHSLLTTGEVSAEEAVRASLERIEATEPAIDALISVQADGALETARAMDKQGPDADKPLWGVPVAVKDLLCTKGVATTCASRILENFVPSYDAFAIGRLKEAGAIIVGKANMDEFAMGSSTESSACKKTKNPWAPDRVPGGSSGGSAASVVAGQVYATLGTDTGGSIRQPASLCGCVGMKPTYGRVSRYGMVAFGSSLDQIGPMTRTVADNARVLSVISGHDPQDSTCSQHPVPDFAAALGRDNLQGLRIGLPEEFWSKGLDSEVEAQCKAVPTLPVLTAFATATAQTRKSLLTFMYSPAAKGSGMKYSAGSCSEPMSFLPAITMHTIAKPRRSAGLYVKTTNAH